MLAVASNRNSFRISELRLRAREAEWPSQNEAPCLCLITGSSRTADIEKILVMGAHGPRRLIVILVRDLD